MTYVKQVSSSQLCPPNLLCVTSTIQKASFFLNNFAPPRLRRHIAILGLLHKRVLGLAHHSFDDLFPLMADTDEGYICPGRHDKQLQCLDSERYRPCLYRRSIFGMVHIYNRLPQAIVDCDNVKDFQKALQELVMERAKAGCDDWTKTFSPRENLATHPLA